MSKAPSNIINDGIYENVSDTVDGTAVVNSSSCNLSESKLLNEECKLNNSDEKAMNNLMNSKDAVYAAPLKKSDRTKTRKSSDGEKISNLKHQNGSDAELQTLMDRTYLNSELGENRIKDFLKDTAHMHKKIEPSGKEHIGSGFSHLARKEHFVNLVHQNILKDQAMEDSCDKNEESEHEKDLINLDDSFEPRGDLEETEKLINKLVDFQNKVAQQSQISQASPSFSSRLISTDVSINLNREWVLKKIAMCLEQKAYKKLPPTLPEIANVNQQQLMQNSNLPVIGYLVLGSNGSGKVSFKFLKFR